MSGNWIGALYIYTANWSSIFFFFKERKTVGQTLTTKAFVFSGKATTATDIAVASPFSDLGDKKKVRHLSQKFQEGALEDIKKNIQAAIDQAKVCLKLTQWIK